MKEYIELLEEYVEINEKLISRGFAYLTVILCHELYRFLYPFEPYLNLSNNQPIEFTKKHIEGLIELAKNFAEKVYPYEINLKGFDSGNIDQSLEKSTSNLYSDLWKDFDINTLTEESLQLLKRRLPQDFIAENVRGKNVLDMGCGSGRYTIALARTGSQKVVGVDFQAKSFHSARMWCKEYRQPVEFIAGDVLELPIGDQCFDFIFCNGVLHHTKSIRKGLEELSRVLKPSGKAFLYIYAAGGIFWRTREVLRGLFKKIPVTYTRMVLHTMGLPPNRFIFCDTWYVPVENYTTTGQLESILEETGLTYKKFIGNSPFDLDRAIAAQIPGATKMWGDGEHRYILEKN
jgi:ubiquinone/menaquinone biosynthesis C-methylase UbiE